MASETLQAAMRQMMDDLAAAAERDELLGATVVHRMADARHEGLSPDEKASLRMAAYRFIRARHEVRDVVMAMVIADRAASVHELVEGMFGHFPTIRLYGEIAAWLDAGFSEPAVLRRVVYAIVRKGTAPMKKLLGARILRAPAQFADTEPFSPSWQRKFASSIARALGDETLAHLVFSQDVRTRQVAARLLLPEKAEHRALAARALASESHLITARFLVEVLEEHPQELVLALSTSPITDAILWRWRAGEDGSFMGLPAHLAIVRDQARREQARKHSTPDPRPSLHEESWAENAQVPHHIFAAAGAIIGLGLAMPIGVEHRDVPRWSYLAAVVPDLESRLEAYNINLGYLLAVERRLDGVRNAMAEEGVRLAAFDERPGRPVNRDRGSRAGGFYEGLLARLTPDALGRTRAGQIAVLASMIDGPFLLDCEGVLGTYHPADHQIILFPWMIELAATVMGWPVTTLESVAILHEASHAILIDGTGAAGKGWETYDRTPERLHEILACMLADATARRLGAVPEAQLAGSITELAAPEACLLADFPGGLATLVTMVREGWFGGISDAVLAMARRVLAERCRTTAESTCMLVRINDLDPWERTILQVAIVQCLVAGPAPRRGSALRLEVEMVRKALQDQRMSSIPHTGEWVFPRVADDPAFLRVQALLEGGEVKHGVPARSSK